VVAEDSTVVVEEDSTAVVEEDFMELVEEGFTAVEVFTPEATPGTAADTTTADIVAAITEDVATTQVATTEDVATTEAAAVMAGAVGAGVTAGAEDIGAEDTVTDGAGVGDLASGGRIGVGDIRMATTTTRGTTHPTLIILTRTIPIRILTTGTTILHRQLLTHRPSPTRKFPSNPGDSRQREKTQPTRTTQTATSRPLHRVGRLSPLTG
jgi:hypothetical protein